MSKAKNTEKDTESQESQDVVHIEDAKHNRPVLKQDVPHTYDAKKVTDFLWSLFEDTVPEGASMLLYAPASNFKGPGLPLQDSQVGLKKIMERTTRGRPLYFSIASVYPAEDGLFRHRREQFAALHVLVLDDIGTKIDPKSIPEALKPTYVIESSPGNCQYGYVLEEPVTDVRAASSLVQAFSLAGLTDKGGVMPTKIVRLPDGINGKDDPTKHAFKVRLVADDGPLWTPEQLLEAIEFEVNAERVTWQDVLASETDLLARQYCTKHLPLKPTAQALNGAIDPVLEWLYKNSLVMGDSGGEWVDIECPQKHLHSTGGADTAGYKPLGRGENPETRGFHCFHEHCADYKTVDFLKYILYNSDISMLPVYDPSATLFATFALDSVNNKVWRYGGGSRLAYNMDGFKTQFNERVGALTIAATGEAKFISTTTANVWLSSPYRTVVAGGVHDPGSDSIVEDENGVLWVNTYRPVGWGRGSYAQAHVDKFLDFLHYLLPSDMEFNYFLDWLASKAQNPLFRGTGIVMVAEAFGVGRSTLGNMLCTLFGVNNSANIAFNELIGGGSYNHWEDKLFITVSEARETTGSGQTKGAYKAYEELKQRVDTTVQEAILNLKFQPHVKVKVCSSYLILTNHINAMAMPEADRRLTVLRNPDKPKQPAFFIHLNNWLNEKDDKGRPAWAKSVYRWLLTHKVGDPARLMLPLNTLAKTDMSEQAAYGPAKAAKQLARHLKDEEIEYIGSKQFHNMVITLLHQSGDPKASDYLDTYVRNCLNDESVCFTAWKLRIPPTKGPERIRVLKHGIESGKIAEYPVAQGKYMPAGDLPLSMRDKALSDVTYLAENMEKVIDAVLQRLQE